MRKREGLKTPLEFLLQVTEKRVCLIKCRELEKNGSLVEITPCRWRLQFNVDFG